MLQVSNLNYASLETILFQRLSVIFTDFTLIYAVKQYLDTCMNSHNKRSNLWNNTKVVLCFLVLCNSGLLIVDHIHFQYNGFLFGIMMLSILRFYQGRIMEGSFWFAILLNFKHIFLYVSPAYFVFLLRNYCFRSTKEGKLKLLSFSPIRFLSLGYVVIAVFAISLGPFVLMGQIQQVISRLFPFKRGLCHAYWAPNFWALYNIADKALVFLGKKSELFDVPDLSAQASMTGGLVQESQHAVLPSVPPIATLVCTLLSIVPILLHTWLYPNGPRGFVRCLTLCAYGSYMFGWHVHEKAILMIIIPLALLSIERKKDAKIFLLVSTVGHASLFPLLFTQPESPIKYGLVLTYTMVAFHAMSKIFSDAGSWHRLPLTSTLETIYLLGLIPMEIYCSLIHNLIGLAGSLPFLPLMITSVYCSCGISYAWLKYYYYCLKDSSINVPLKMD